MKEENDDSGNSVQSTLDKDSNTDETTKTYQERVHELYGSERLRETTLGFGVKFLIEFLVAAMWMVVFVLLPGSILTWLHIGPFSYTQVVLGWLSFSATVTLATWCFTGATLGSDEESED